jgi:hypothetical protein
MLSWISGVWCKTMHRQAMWPIHGRYLCPTCLHEYVVDWEQPDISAPTPVSEATPEGAMSISSTAPVIY